MPRRSRPSRSPETPLVNRLSSINDARLFEFQAQAFFALGQKVNAWPLRSCHKGRSTTALSQTHSTLAPFLCFFVQSGHALPLEHAQVMLLFPANLIGQGQGKQALVFQVERKEVACRPIRFRLGGFVRRMSQVMAVLGVQVKRRQGAAKVSSGEGRQASTRWRSNPEHSATIANRRSLAKV